MDDQRVVSISAAQERDGDPAPGSATEVDNTALHDVSVRKNVEEFLQDLIKKQCALVDGFAGLVLLRPTREQADSSQPVQCLLDPDNTLTKQQRQRLLEIARTVAHDNKPVVEALTASQGMLSDKPEFRVLGVPLRLAGRPQGSSLCVLPYDHHADTQDDITRLELSGLLLESYIWREQAYAEAQAKVQMRETLDLVDKAYQGHTAREMASLFAHEMQRRFGCVRVSIGLVHGHAIRLVALSGSDDVDRKSALAEAIESVMEECADQDTEIRYPQPDDASSMERRVVRAHKSLSEHFGPVSIASFPLRITDGLIGVAVLERSADDPFNDSSLHLLRLIAEYLGPTLWTRRLADRGILSVSKDRAIDFAEVMVGPKRTGPKMLGLAVLVLLLVSVFLPVSDRVVSEGRIIAQERRQVSSPFSERIEQVLIKPGDVVAEGQELVILRTKEIEYQLFQLKNQLRRLHIQADEARASGKIFEAKMVDAEIGVTQADLDLLLYKISQSRIKAPIAGVITQGNLDDMEGEVIKPDQPILEIAQLSTLTAIILVPESGVVRVEPGQEGQLALSARPSVKIEFIVKSITPASEIFQQQNVYRVEVEVRDAPDWLRPGMEGQAKIYGGRTNLFTIYTRPLFDAIRIRLWW